MQRHCITKTRGALYAIILLALFISLAGCRSEPTTIADIAYDRRTRSRNTDFRIYIEENGIYVPYLVLTANYGGNVLLLREHLLDDSRPFNISPHGHDFWARQDFGAYYPDSYIDNFLNTDFKNTLGAAVLAAMVPSYIAVTAKESLSFVSRSTYTITRYVFLLSFRELGVPDPLTSVPEGEVLRFFRGHHSGRVASFSDGRASPYWTRTPQTWETFRVFSIGVNATGAGSVSFYNGVRPAFSLCRSTPITTRTDIISEETVFVISINNQ
ncbi:MAG: DUF6273 domain-containing protein [Defluviitaleaceae bacterium]|nr:DUF6273 domain-containing protein [Defluviitaleaceae bacterium]